MTITADTNTFLAVALNEKEKDWLIRVTEEQSLLAPAVLPYELGNALSSLVRRKSVTPSQLEPIWDAIEAISVELMPVDVKAALLLAGEFRIYAYDAYFLQCSLENRAPLLTLDRRLQRIARKLDITVVE